MKDLTNKLTADKARSLYTEHVNNVDIEKYVDIIDKKIEEASIKGAKKLNLWPISSLKYSSYAYYTNVILPTLRKHYESAGFKIVYVDNPDPGHPCSHDYEYIEW